MLKYFKHSEHLNKDTAVLLGLRTSFEDFQLSYFLNSKFGTHFVKSTPIDGDKGIKFARFVWEDSDLNAKWIIISNKEDRSICDSSERSLFSDPCMARFYFLQKEKQIDYLIAVEGYTTVLGAKMQEILEQINALDYIFAFVMKKDKNYLNKMAVSL